MFLFKTIASSAKFLFCAAVFLSSASYGFDPFLQYSVYSEQGGYIGPRSILQGAIQSDGDFLVDAQSTVNGDILSGNNATIRSYCKVTGSILAAGSAIVSSSAQIDGIVNQRYTVVPITLATKTVPVGSTNITVAAGAIYTLNPGTYNAITINAGGKLVFKKGTYNCRSFTAWWDAKIQITSNYNDMTMINVKENMTMYDRTKMSFNTPHAPDAVEIYSNQSVMLDIGPESVINALITCPNGEVRLRDRVKLAGGVYAKKVTILADVICNGVLSVDSDLDNVGDYIEDMAGTDKYDQKSKPAEIIKGTWRNRTDMTSQSIMLRYKHYTNYSTCDSIPVFMDKNSLASDNMLIHQLIDKNAFTGTPLPPGVYSVDSSYQQICCSAIRSSSTIEWPFVISDGMQHFPGSALKLYHYDCATDIWNQVEISRIENKMVYANISEGGIYAVSAYQNVLTVDISLSADAHPNYKNLSSALAWLVNKHQVDGEASNRYEVHVAKGSYTCNGQIIPANTYIRGGYATGFLRNMPNSENETRIIPGSTTKAALVASNNGYFYTDAVNYFTDYAGTLIDGFIFDGSSNYTQAVTAQAGAVHITGAWHLRDIRFKNCVFFQNVGTMGGAVFVNNASLIFFDNCVFTENKSLAGGVFADIMCPPPASGLGTCRSITNTDGWSGGAAAIYEFSGCGAEVEFHSCLFHKNSTTYPASGITNKNGGTIAIYGGAGAGRPVKVVNCTFTENTITNGDASVAAKSVYSGAHGAMSGTPVVLRNSIFYGNTGHTNEIYGISVANVTYKTNIRTAYNPDPPVANPYTIPGISYCIVQGMNVTGDVNGNKNDDPEFDNPAIPKGIDNRWLTVDDGFNVKFTSKARKSSLAACLPEHTVAAETDYKRDQFVDAANRTRLGYEISSIKYSDMGAYEKYLNIMCIGDDNTVGYDPQERSDTKANYRKYLSQKLKDKNIEFDFVGSVNDGLTADIQHEGYLSPANSAINGKIESFYSSTYNLAGKFTHYKPDIVILMVGSQNIKAESADDAFAKLYHTTNTSLVPTILSSLKIDGRLFIATIPPVLISTSSTTNYPLFNSKITGTNWAGIDLTYKRVTVSNIDPTSVLVNKINEDLITVTDEGYELISGNLFNSLLTKY